MKTKFRFGSKDPMRISAFNLSMILSLLAFSAQAGSLWREAVTDERGMFSDKVARRIGDIVTVVVAESAVTSNSVRLTTDKSSDATGAGGIVSNVVGQFVKGANEKLKGSSKFPLNILPTPNGGITLPTPAVSGASKFGGGGEITDAQKMTASMAVQVVDRLPNGNLVIEGIRQIGFAKERQFASLRGIIRPYDISITNTISSTAVADARIDIVSEGSLSSAQKKGWLLRLDEKISPY